jgi:prevent-host-death family protein
MWKGSPNDRGGASVNVLGLREAKTKLTELGRRAQKGQRALITRHGKPFLVVVGVEGDDFIDVMIRWDPSFWKDLDRRRRASATASVALEDVEVAPTRSRRRRR